MVAIRVIRDEGVRCLGGIAVTMKHPGAAGADVRANLPGGRAITLEPGQRALGPDGPADRNPPRV